MPWLLSRPSSISKAVGVYENVEFCAEWLVVASTCLKVNVAWRSRKSSPASKKLSSSVAGRVQQQLTCSARTRKKSWIRMTSLSSVRFPLSNLKSQSEDRLVIHHALRGTLSRWTAERKERGEAKVVVERWPSMASASRAVPAIKPTGKLIIQLQEHWIARPRLDLPAASATMVRTAEAAVSAAKALDHHQPTAAAVRAQSVSAIPSTRAVWPKKFCGVKGGSLGGALPTSLIPSAFRRYFRPIQPILKCKKFWNKFATRT